MPSMYAWTLRLMSTGYSPLVVHTPCLLKKKSCEPPTAIDSWDEQPTAMTLSLSVAREFQRYIPSSLKTMSSPPTCPKPEIFPRESGSIRIRLFPLVQEIEVPATLGTELMSRS